VSNAGKQYVCNKIMKIIILYGRMKTDIPAWYWRIWPQFNIGIYNVDIYKQQYNRKYKKYHRGYTGDDN
jgi:hypothetical protein